MRVSFLSLSVILGSLLLASAAISLWLWLARRRRDAQLREHGKPVLVMPFSSSPDVPRTPIVHDVLPMRRSPITALAVAERLTLDDYELVPRSRVDELATMTTGETTGDEIAEMIQGRSLRFHRPVDRTHEPLPGALRVVEGPDEGQEIRFVRLSESEEPTITFGRSEGLPYRHVQLLEPTVSRTHARMAFVDDQWMLTNLSRTNPVSVNGVPLRDEHPRALAEGDLVEMGTLAFRFIAR